MRLTTISLLMMVMPFFLQGQDCKLNLDEMTPIIQPFNPFFIKYTWDQNQKIEKAKLDENRAIIIKQKGCERHHIMFTLLIHPDLVSESPRFWVTESLVMMKRVYFDNPKYLEFKQQFEISFIKGFLDTGLWKSFSFPVGEKSFICYLENDPRGAKINIEMVRYVMNYKIITPGVTRQQDDGYFVPTN